MRPERSDVEKRMGVDVGSPSPELELEVAGSQLVVPGVGLVCRLGLTGSRAQNKWLRE